MAWSLATKQVGALCLFGMDGASGRKPVGMIAIEWVKKYHGRASNLSNTQAQAEGFYNTLSGTRRFNWGDDLAWDQDFEEQGVGSPGSGTDRTWVDSVDFVFFSGHGSTGGPLFGVTTDNGVAAPTEVRWGNQDLEWIALDACNVLERDGVFDRWGWPVFRGLHYILGFHTTTGDESKRGRYLAENLNDGLPVREAWIRACQETEGSDVEWAYLRADAPGTNTFADHWHGKGFVSADPTNPTTLFYLRGSC